RDFHVTGVQTCALPIYPPTADPSTGRLYASHRRSCSAAGYLGPTDGVDVDDPSYAGVSEGGATPNETPTTGRTVAAWAPVAGAQIGRASCRERERSAEV